MATTNVMDPRIVELGNQAIMSPGSVVNSDRLNYILDDSWTKTAFLISDSELGDTADIQNRYWSTADAVFTDTRLGCNIGINPRPQFTRYSDIRSKGRNKSRNNVTLTDVEGNYGMGRYYREAIDEPAQTVYLRFGVPQFNSVMSFLANAYDSDMTSMARTGRSSSIFYKFGKAVGTITAVINFPMVAAAVILGKGAAYLLSRPTSKFYTMKPTMHNYWGVVNNLVTAISVTRGLLPKMIQDNDTNNSNKGQRLGQPHVVDQESLDLLASLMPGVFGGNSLSGNTFDVYSIANRAQRVANQVFADDYAALNNGTPTSYVGYLKKELTGTGSHSTYISTTEGKSLAARLNEVFTFGNYKLEDKENKLEKDPRTDPNATDPRIKKEEGWYDKLQTWQGDASAWKDDLLKHFDSEFRDGSQFAIFKVDHTGVMTESFSNALMESDMSQKINGISSSMKQARFTFGEGNVVGGVVGDVIGGIAGAATDLVMGGLDGITMGFSNILKGLGGSGYIDIPKHWQNSNATLTRSTYTMDLVSPYGNVVSQLINIFIPYSMILAGGLPLSTGKQSYTSPLLCQLYDRGRSQIKLGMIESITAERGTTNLAFNTNGNMMAMRVTFTVADLSSIMHMPVSGDGLFQTDITIDEDNILSDYIAVLSGQDLYSQIYAIPKAKLRLAKVMASTRKLTSPAWMASSVHDTFGALTSVIEGLNRGNSGAAGPVQ